MQRFFDASCFTKSSMELELKHVAYKIAAMRKENIHSLKGTVLLSIKLD